MAKLSNRVQNALDEARILILGSQVLLGFEFRSFFEPRFDALPGWAQAAKATALCAITVGFALFLAPGPFHRLAEGGEDGPRVHRFATAAAGLGLFPFAAALGLDVAVGVAAVPALGGSAAAAVGTGAAAGAAALALWYAWPAAVRRTPQQEDEMERASVDKKIRHVLTEARMVLPGAQAMLGFQLAVTLMEAFEKLPARAQLAHLGAVLLSALTVALLVAPAAFHRIAEGGDETERFHRIASRLVLAALPPLALSMALELGIVGWKLTESPGAAAGVAGGAAAVLLGTWFLPALAGRARRRQAAGAHA
jgi:hypothetical protein